MRVIIFLLSIIILIIFFFYGIIKISSTYNESSNDMSANIGKQIVLGKDTLVVIDYNSVMENYTLSNGLSVSKQIVEAKN